VIKIESVHIEEVRGIRKLDIDFGRQKFAISGPNGSGKSGVIDAIEFGLTGQMGRLTGRGTKGLSVAEHGPHVDKAKFPDAAFVELKIFLTDLNKSVKITRKISAPKKPKIEPADPGVEAALAEIAEHPEITLSRREVLRFILVEPTKRSEEIQSLLKLDEIGRTRSALNTAQNRLTSAHSTAVAQLQSRRNALTLHLQITTPRSDDLLEAVNKRRKILDLPAIDELTADTKLDAGLAGTASAAGFNKESALRDVKALSDAQTGFPELAKMESAAIVSDLARLEADPSLLAALQSRAFVERGLQLATGAACPLCDLEWPSPEHLREHLKTKLSKSEEARKLQEALLKNASAITAKAIGVAGLLGAVLRLALSQGQNEFAQLLTAWRLDLETFRAKLTAVDKIADLKERFEGGWLEVPATFPQNLKAFNESLVAKPDQTAALDAQTFLSTAQMRLSDYREGKRNNNAAGISKQAAKTAYDTYCAVLETELNSLYDEVQKDFSTFYRAINESDESKFTAKLTPTEGSLGLDVNFYERGLFPPAAYHSEGHQDGMGVCLYLALMKRLFGPRFQFSLLDDVVMSVDSGHRYQFCKLLKAYFPDTQFIITTHDRVWAAQMKSAGLVTAKTSIAFHAWTIDGGPLVETDEEIWDEIAVALGKGRVEAAAAALRHHLEYVSRHLADQLAARPNFREDNNYELGEMLPSVLQRMKELCGQAANTAQSWGNDAIKQAAGELKETLSTCNAAMSVEQWAVNKAVHYNAWANFGKNDFEPVVAAFKELLGCFRCDKCDSWIYITPRVSPESLRCSCSAINFNLKPKGK
jgi:recombinational DNA repair ATPase RecF